MKKLFSFFAAALMAVSLMAETVSITKFTTVSGDMDGNISYESFQGGANTAPAVSSSAIRLYQRKSPTSENTYGGYIVITAKNGNKLSEIKFTNGIDGIYAVTFDEIATLGDDMGSGTAVKNGDETTISCAGATYAAIYVLGTSSSSRLYIKTLEVSYSANGAEAVSVTGVSLNNESLTLVVGDFANLVATIAPENATNKGVTWSTSNNEVATVTNGKVVAVAEGTANITATTKDGEFTATCAVTVNKKTIPEGAIFFETFDKIEGTGGNDGAWSGSVAGSAFDAAACDNEGWTTTGDVYSANKCVRMGKSKDATEEGGFKAPALGKAGDGKVQFKSESWGSDGSNFFVKLIGGGTFVADENLAEGNITEEGTVAKVANKKAGTWTTFTLSFEGVTAETVIHFYAPLNKRAFLDEIAIWVEEKETPEPEDDEINWEPIAWLGDGAQGGALSEKYKMYVPEGSTVNIINIQTAPWDNNNTGIYVNFPSAENIECSLGEGNFKIEGAGMLLHLDVFTAKETKFTLGHAGNTYKCAVYYANGTDSNPETGINNVESVKVIKTVKNGQVVIIREGVEYNVMGAQL